MKPHPESGGRDDGDWLRMMFQIVVSTVTGFETTHILLPNRCAVLAVITVVGRATCDRSTKMRANEGVECMHYVLNYPIIKL